LPELLSSSDIVSLHTPLTEETRGLIGREELALMRPGAVLVNTARGPVVDSAALSEALKEGRIRAGIDVYEKDPPLPADHPLVGAPNLVCTPHIGFNTRESIERRAAMAFENVTAFLNGHPIRLVV
ncbi:MAG: hydroxyacid dehydrogenase, partial [Clostridia bacterium]|nr:hydroxyacid dehydrogenase [Clostridia bacterium]